MSRHSISVCLSLLLLLSCNNSESKRPIARGGLLDLREWDFSQNGPIDLNGEWEFYWEKFVRPGEIEKKRLEHLAAIVPSRWNEITDSGKKLGSEGYATYRLRILLPATAHGLAIHADGAQTSYRVFWNGKEIASQGVVSASPEDARPRYGAVTVGIDSAPVSELIVWASNYHHRNGGLIAPVSLGLSTDLIRARNYARLRDAFLIGTLLIMALYHFSLYLGRRKDTSGLWFAFLCLSMVVRLTVTGERLIVQEFPDWPWELFLKLEYLSFYLSVLVGVLFMGAVLPLEIGKYAKRATIAVCLPACAIVLVTYARFYTQTIVPFQIFTLGAGIYGTAAMVRAIYRGRPGARLMLAGWIFFFLTIAYDIITNLVWKRLGNTTPIGLFFFVFSQASVLSGLIAMAFANSEELSENLEKKVEERTSELELARAEADSARLEVEGLLVVAEDARAKLAEADRAKTSFFQNISHELRTPLTLIAGPVDSARRRGESLDEAAMNMVAANARRMQRLVNQLLDLQKITAGKMEVDRVAMDIGSFLRAACESFAPFAETRGIRIKDEIATPLPGIFADVDKIDKCIYNYVSNALKFTAVGGTITLRATSDGGRIRVAVEDTGTGIPADKISGLFTRFGHSESSLTREQEGTGLGLSLVKELIELHGGSVGVESKVGLGSIFWFEIDALTADQGTVTASMRSSSAAIELSDIYGPAGQSPKHSELEEPSATAHRVLIVDDNQDLRNYMISIFARAGYATSSAENGVAGLERAIANPPDLIVTDLMMPKMSGAEMATEIRKVHDLRTVPIVLLTAKADEETRADVRSAGVDVYLAKPFSDTELLTAVKNLLSLKCRERALLAELEQARAIQQGLLPAELPRIPGIDLAAIYEPMELVGGDMYDFLEFEDGTLGLFIADVSGHGIPAAMIASLAKLILTMHGPSVRSPAKLLRYMNEQLIGKMAENFITVCYAVLSPDRRSLSYATGGHPPILLLRDGTAIYQRAKGTIVGWFPEAKFEDRTIEIQAGDRFFLYSDGLTEASDREGKQLMEERLALLAQENQTNPVGVQIKQIVAEAKRYHGGGPFEDDVTIVGVAVS